MKFIDKIEEKIEKFFSWLNKEPENKKVAIAQTLVAMGMFIGVFSIMGLAATIIGAN